MAINMNIIEVRVQYVMADPQITAKSCRYKIGLQEAANKGK